MNIENLNSQQTNEARKVRKLGRDINNKAQEESKKGYAQRLLDSVRGYK